MTLLELYSKQTMLVESLLEAHPDFAPAVESGYAAEDTEFFRRVFTPNWDQYADVGDAFTQHFGKSQGDWRRAQLLFERFCDENGVERGDLQDKSVPHSSSE